MLEGSEQGGNQKPTSLLGVLNRDFGGLPLADQTKMTAQGLDPKSPTDREKYFQQNNPASGIILGGKVIPTSEGKVFIGAGTPEKLQGAQKPISPESVDYQRDVNKAVTDSPRKRVAGQ